MCKKKKDITNDLITQIDLRATRTHNLGLRRATRYHCANRPVAIGLWELAEWQGIYLACSGCRYMTCRCRRCKCGPSRALDIGGLSGSTAGIAPIDEGGSLRFVGFHAFAPRALDASCVVPLTED